MAGRGLILTSTALFLGPLVLAIVGANCWGETQESNLLGAIAGLAAGMVASVVAWRLRGGSCKESV